MTDQIQQDTLVEVAKAIRQTDDLGKADSRDFVIAAVETLGMQEDDERDERIADELWDDAGESITDDLSCARFICARLLVADHGQRVARAKAEILSDVRDGVVPSSVSSFSQLHDYVDANEYGGLCEDDAMTGDYVALGIAVQAEVDAWLVKGGVRLDAEVERMAREGSSVSAPTNTHGDTQAVSYTLQRFDAVGMLESDALDVNGELLTFRNYTNDDGEVALAFDLAVGMARFIIEGEVASSEASEFAPFVGILAHDSDDPYGDDVTGWGSGWVDHEAVLHDQNVDDDPLPWTRYFDAPTEEQKIQNQTLVERAAYDAERSTSAHAPRSRTILVHLNVEVGPDDTRSADEIADEIGAALEVGMQGAPSGSTASGSGSSITITLADEVA